MYIRVWQKSFAFGQVPHAPRLGLFLRQIETPDAQREKILLKILRPTLAAT